MIQLHVDENEEYIQRLKQKIDCSVIKCHPFGIDVSSGVETNGWKDEEKIGKIIALTRTIG
ncbi:hypothetical protein [Desulfosporosinus sp. SB140]|uniref:phosphoribosylanthranilate isomerase n=1 Tax=Desulfosporosinus paludis TaxID=3115649 RepID=UPI0038911254